ncbi:extracellular solute-binding protein [Pseudobutyrivibrio sp. YE44]|uniref:extracellular solute-binding protein n=1 Tax=Pseudobutyrivibrio sp. YE44 TaxID=1520802 RepID=UPI000B80FB85|nr:extracellular solute-binding protein [Pseudobutyrivibrio sp. YE44]
MGFIKNVFGKKRIMIATIVVATIALIGILVGVFGFGSRNTSHKERLVVASPHPVDFVKPLIHEFELETGIEVELISCSSSEAISLIEEDESVDVMWGGSVLSVGKNTDNFYDYRCKSYDNIYPAYQNIAPGVTCFSDVPSILIVNTDIAGNIIINGYEDLLNPKLKGKIAFANPAHSSSSFEHLVNMLYAMGQGKPEKGWDYVGKLVNQLDGNICGSSSEVYEGVANGKYVVGLTFEEAAITMLNSDKHVRIVYMDEGVVSTCDGIYINKNTKALDKAETFVDFMTSYDTQSFMAKNLGRRSVRTDVSNSVSVLSKDQINMLEVDRDEIISNKSQWIDKFNQLIGEDNHGKRD